MLQSDKRRALCINIVRGEAGLKAHQHHVLNTGEVDNKTLQYSFIHAIAQAQQPLATAQYLGQCRQDL